MENDLLLCGILAILGSLGVAAGDAFLLGTPVSGKTFRERRLETLLHVSPRKMLIGHTLGVLVLPVVFFGVYQVYRGLEPAGLAYALPPVLILGYGLVVGAAAHACFAFLGGAMHFHEKVGENGAEAAEALVAAHKRLLYPLFGAFLAALIIGSFWFSYVVWSQPTLYPRWIAFTNPFVLIIVFSLLESQLPSPLGGYIRPANANISFAVFFALSTFVLV